MQVVFLFTKTRWEVEMGTENDLLREIFLDGHLIIDDTLDAIRKRIQDNV